MEIHGLNKTTLLDYPEHVACTVFTGHCNMRCPYCQNADLVLYPGSQPILDEEEFFAFLKKRAFSLEGVCITGGEPTLQKDLKDFIKKIKERSLNVKLDTNGTNPALLKELIDEKLIDYAAIDIKSSKENYGKCMGIENYDTSAVEESVSILINGDLPYEFRTTVVKELMDREDFVSIGNWLKGAKQYFLQSYEESGRILYKVANNIDESETVFHAYSKDELQDFADMLTGMGINTKVRGI